MGAAGRRADEFMQFGSPAQFAAFADRRPDPLFVGEVPRKRTGHPAADVVETRGRLDQVKHGLLDPGPRRTAVPLHRLHRPPRPVQADPADRRDMTLSRDRHVNRFDRLIGEAL
jgi:hypothetical protein